jgi:hypothetical protein
MSTTPIPYDPDLLSVERATHQIAKTGSARTGHANLNATVTTWVDVPFVSVSYSSDYSAVDHADDPIPAHYSTLVVGSETAQIDISRWDTDLGSDGLYPSDQVRIMYGTTQILLGVVEGVQITRTRVPEADRYGATLRVDISASVVGLFASMLSRTVSWPHALPAEPWYPNRISRFVSVTNW